MSPEHQARPRHFPDILPNLIVVSICFPEYDRVELRRGCRYRVRWWTQGEQPSGSDVWEDLDSQAVRPENVGGWSYNDVPLENVFMEAAADDDKLQRLALFERLHTQGKLLTAAVLSGVTADGNIYYDAAAQTNAVLNAVDFINVMAYNGGDGERHSQYRFAVACPPIKWCWACPSMPGPAGRTTGPSWP